MTQESIQEEIDTDGRKFISQIVVSSLGHEKHAVLWGCAEVTFECQTAEVNVVVVLNTI